MHTIKNINTTSSTTSPDGVIVSNGVNLQKDNQNTDNDGNNAIDANKNDNNEGDVKNDDEAANNAIK